MDLRPVFRNEVGKRIRGGEGGGGQTLLISSVQILFKNPLKICPSCKQSAKCFRCEVLHQDIII